MLTTARYQSDLKTYGALDFRKAAHADLRLLGLWSMVGLTLTGLLFAMGLGTEIGQALMMAG